MASFRGRNDEQFMKKSLAQIVDSDSVDTADKEIVAEALQPRVHRLSVQMSKQKIPCKCCSPLQYFSFKYCMYKLWAQIQVVAPIAAYMMIFQTTALRSPVEDLTTIMLGLVAVVIGLAIFLEGLEVGLMPIGEKVGITLPKKKPLWITYIICFILGIGVTFAEPSIEALQTLGVLLDPEIQPYLYFVLNEPYDILLVLFIGLGVGVGCVLGVQRMSKGGKLKRQIYTALTPCILLSIYMTWFNDSLDGVVDLCWDCGAITTGPVTVPIVLALGIGLASSRDTGASKLSGFGVVTLASLYPIISVQILMIILSFAVSRDFILDNVAPGDDDDPEIPWFEQTPYDEILASLQSVGPLVVFMLIILYLVLKENLPVGSFKERVGTFFEEDLDADEQEDTFGTSNPVFDDEEEDLVGGYLGSPKAKRSSTSQRNGKLEVPLSPRSFRSPESLRSGTPRLRHASSIERAGSLVGNAVMKGRKSASHYYQKLSADLSVDIRQQSLSVIRNDINPENWTSTLTVVGIFMVFIGMLTFTLGLRFGLGQIGEQAGSATPALFADIRDEGYPGSPYYDEGSGLAIAVVFIFVLGLGATIAEPALSVLGQTVEDLTEKKFKKFLLIGVVALGVGIGIAVAILKVVFNFPLMYALIPAYMLALVLTVLSDDDFVGVAWDSAGVTTGPITVPLILTLGVGFGGVLETPGFGILALASVGPIISVLFCGIIVNRQSKDDDDTRKSIHSTAVSDFSQGRNARVKLKDDDAAEQLLRSQPL